MAAPQSESTSAPIVRCQTPGGAILSCWSSISRKSRSAITSRTVQFRTAHSVTPTCNTETIQGTCSPSIYKSSSGMMLSASRISRRCGLAGKKRPGWAIWEKRGQPWGYSDVEFGPDRHTPDCMWLDANHDAPAKGWGGNANPLFRLLYPREKVNKKSEFFCNPPVSVYVKDPPELTLGDQNRDYNRGKFWTKSTPKKRRSLDDMTENNYDDQEASRSPSPRGKPSSGNVLPSGKSLEHQLIITTRITHNLTASCSDETLMGPDIVNLVEGFFCEMSTRTLYEVCGDNHRGHTCFDHNVRSLRKAGNLVARGSGEYKKVHSWAA